MSVRIKRLLSTLIGILAFTQSYNGYAQLITLKLQLKWKHQFQFAGHYAALQKGYYKAEGIDLHILEGGKNISPIEVITSGRANLGIFDPEILFKNPKRNPLTAIFATMQSSPYSVISLQKKGIRRPIDLVGKKILIGNDQGWNIFRAIMLKEGLSIGHTTIISRNLDSEEILDDAGDAVITYSASQASRLKKLGADLAIMNPLDYGIDFYGDVIFTTQKFANNSPEVIEAFNRATRKGWEYALKHPEKLANYILTLPGVQERGVTKQDLLDEADQLEKLILPNFVEIGHINPGRWQNMLSVYQNLGLADGQTSLKGFLFSNLEKKHPWYDILVYTLTIGGVLFIIAIVLNWELRRQVLAKTSALRKEIEERQKAEERLELAIEAAGLGLWELDLKEQKAYINQRWIANQLGYFWENPNLNISDWINLIHPEDKPNFNKDNTKFLASNTSSNQITYRIKTSEGDWLWLLSFRKISERDEVGNPVKITGMHLNIDNIKRKELELRQLTKELLKKNSELEKFAYITSHNLRAPVVNLRSLTEIHASGDLPADLEEEINQKIRQSVIQLDNTLNDLVEIVSSKSGNKVHIEELSFQTELDQVMTSIENQIQSSNALVESDFSEVNKVFFPRKYLVSILQNLLTNAIKYRSPERQLVIKMKTRLERDFIIFTFSDNGTGFNMARFKSKIFNLYQRFHSHIEGKGLGLYLIRSQVEAMDGKIDVESVEHVGTTFHIHFPRTPYTNSGSSVS
ncbi:MAG TPA: ABC transporter substrate-binding protein [Daejeonella sp.]|nr:ABC transporter substrate-binding protein [Daejeonella sp.]